MLVILFGSVQFGRLIGFGCLIWPIWFGLRLLRCVVHTITLRPHLISPFPRPTSTASYLHPLLARGVAAAEVWISPLFSSRKWDWLSFVSVWNPTISYDTVAVYKWSLSCRAASTLMILEDCEYPLSVSFPFSVSFCQSNCDNQSFSLQCEENVWDIGGEVWNGE